MDMQKVTKMNLKNKITTKVFVFSFWIEIDSDKD